MTHPVKTTSNRWQPGDVLPLYADRETIAKIITHSFFPVSVHTIRRWPLVGRCPNKRVIYKVEDALEYARQRLEAAPAVTGGR